MEFSHPALPRQVAQVPSVSAVDAEGGAPTQRTSRLFGTHMGRDSDPIGINENVIDDKAGREQRKQ